MGDQTTRVLFVGGYGRSGSTILDILLDRFPGITAVGEFRHLFGRALGDNELCSCGAPFRECAYWTEVLTVAFPDGYDRKRIHAAVRAINRVVKAPALLHPSLQSASMRQHAAVYRDAFTAAYRAVATVSGASVVVDSTKYPLHGLFLRSVPSLDLSTMLLVRDPRAVAYSWTRHRLRPEVHWEEREMPRYRVSRSAFAWDLSNTLTRIEMGDRPFRVQRYEDFVERPVEQLGEIASFALGRSVEVDQSLFETQPRVPHTIAGNPVRLGSETVTVRADLAWQEKMPAMKKQAVTVLCLPQMHRYGYRINARAEELSR
jgi:hypothetical protein